MKPTPNRKSPIEHDVHKHHRKGRIVHKYKRGKGKAVPTATNSTSTAKKLKWIRPSPTEGFDVKFVYDKGSQHEAVGGVDPRYALAKAIPRARDAPKSIVIERRR